VWCDQVFCYSLATHADINCPKTLLWIIPKLVRVVAVVNQRYSWLVFIVSVIDVKKRFYVFFYFGHVFLRFYNVFFYFPRFLFFKKTLAKFRAASRLTRSTFKKQQRNRPMIFLLHVEWPEMPSYKLLLTYLLCLTCVWMAYSELPWRPFLVHQAWSWTILRRGNVFYYVYKRILFLSRFLTFLTLFIFIWTFFTSMVSVWRCTVAAKPHDRPTDGAVVYARQDSLRRHG